MQTEQVKEREKQLTQDVKFLTEQGRHLTDQVKELTLENTLLHRYTLEKETKIETTIQSLNQAHGQIAELNKLISDYKEANSSLTQLIENLSEMKLNSNGELEAR